jgi:hypothetical protein
MIASTIATSFKLAVQNPSDYSRGGSVITPWPPIAACGVSAQEFVVRQGGGAPLRAQVERIDPDDPSRDVLVFLLDRPVPPGKADYSRDSDLLTIEAGEPARQPGPTIITTGPEGQTTGFKLVNNVLSVWFSLVPKPWPAQGDWYAGAATSVELKHKEVLDAFRAEIGWLGHDPEKRCMQIDHIRVPRAAWEQTPELEQVLIHQPYELLRQSQGPVRASATIASSPFDYPFVDPVSKRQGNLRCRLYRVVSLYQDADYVQEEIYLKGAIDGAPGRPLDLNFSASYFAYMDMGLDPSITHFPQIPDWLAIGCQWSPFQGYGFATDVHAGPIANPHPGFPKPKCGHKSFSWEIGMGKSATCAHLFGRGAVPERLASGAGGRWYESIFKPLRARFLGEGE